MGAVKQLELQTIDLGMEHARNAVETWVQVNILDDLSPYASALETLQGIVLSDTETMESLPSDNLSGEYADDYDTNDLASDLGINVKDSSIDTATLDLFGELADTYQSAFSQTAIQAVESRCREIIREGVE